MHIKKREKERERERERERDREGEIEREREKMQEIDKAAMRNVQTLIRGADSFFLPG